MKKIRLLFLTIIILVMCTGCSIEYNINITEDNIEETIYVNDYFTSSRTRNDILTHYDMWYPVFVNYVTEGETIELEDFSEKAPGVEYYNKNINETANGYKYSYEYTYDIDDYYDSYALATTFIEPTVHKSYDALVLKTSQENLLCNYDYFDTLKVNITIDPEVYKLNTTNTSNVRNNTYTWTLDKSNCNDSQILLTLDIINNNIDDIISDKNEKNNKNKLSDYALYIFLGILLILIFIGYNIYKKIKAKNDNFTEDD